MEHLGVVAEKAKAFIPGHCIVRNSNGSPSGSDMTLTCRLAKVAILVGGGPSQTVEEFISSGLHYQKSSVEAVCTPEDGVWVTTWAL